MHVDSAIRAQRRTGFADAGWCRPGAVAAAGVGRAAFADFAALAGRACFAPLASLTPFMAATAGGITLLIGGTIAGAGRLAGRFGDGAAAVGAVV